MPAVSETRVDAKAMSKHPEVRRREEVRASARSFFSGLNGVKLRWKRDRGLVEVLEVPLSKRRRGEVPSKREETKGKMTRRVINEVKCGMVNR